VPGGQTREALTAWGVEDVDALLASGAAVQA
jgi:alpha-methylacyl-CoA racemase